jgi:hypothetical protein
MISLCPLCGAELDDQRICLGTRRDHPHAPAMFAGGDPKITEVQRLEIKPGDRLIVHVGERDRIDVETAAHIRTRLRAALQLPGDMPIAIVTEGWQFEVVPE